ncbi:MAG: hypothetical protein M1826_002863 [Phylliscum demangeonii]|nr:MAG: hypothetical protein M1826_002863 [Phylliscum demangeonii]
MVSVFAVPIFFVLFRETLETAIIVSVLLAFLKHSVDPQKDAAIFKRMRKQVWYGTGAGLAICTVIGAGVIGAFYGLGKNRWSGAEEVWEGAFALLTAVIITVMGAALLRVSKIQGKWKAKLEKALDARRDEKTGRWKRWAEKYAMFLLPFVTVLREGVEAVIFVGGVSLGQPASSIPLAVLAGMAAGTLVGWFMYKGGNLASIRIFLVVSTCFLYLVAAGLVSKAAWLFQSYQWSKATGGDAAESGSGPGSYDIRQSVWHVNCCNPKFDGGGGWGIFNALFGWTNSATYGSVVSYNAYWILVVLSFLVMRYREETGRWPLQRRNPKVVPIDSEQGSVAILLTEQVAPKV